MAPASTTWLLGHRAGCRECARLAALAEECSAGRLVAVPLDDPRLDGVVPGGQRRPVVVRLTARSTRCFSGGAVAWAAAARLGPVGLVRLLDGARRERLRVLPQSGTRARRLLRGPERPDRAGSRRTPAPGA